MVPSSSATSTSTVGLPRESRISRAPTASMLATAVLLRAEAGSCGRAAATDGLRLPAYPGAAVPRLARRGLQVEQGAQPAGRRRPVLEHRVMPLPLAQVGAGCGQVTGDVGDLHV